MSARNRPMEKAYRRAKRSVLKWSAWDREEERRAALWCRLAAILSGHAVTPDIPNRARLRPLQLAARRRSVPKRIEHRGRITVSFPLDEEYMP